MLAARRLPRGSNIADPSEPPAAKTARLSLPPPARCAADAVMKLNKVMTPWSE